VDLVQDEARAVTGGDAVNVVQHAARISHMPAGVGGAVRCTRAGAGSGARVQRGARQRGCRSRYARLLPSSFTTPGRFTALIGMSCKAALLAWEAGCGRGVCRGYALGSGDRKEERKLSGHGRRLVCDRRRGRHRGSDRITGITIGGCGKEAPLSGEHIRQPTTEWSLFDAD
jgi:hypothetical protein